MSNEAGMVLTKAEKRLIEVIRSLDYGEVRVMIKDSHPIRVEEIRRSIQLLVIGLEIVFDTTNAISTPTISTTTEI